MRVLLVEDERELADVLADGLRSEGYTVHVAADGAAALAAVGRHDVDLLVLDRDLPGLSGDDVCRVLRSQGHPARILMLTASSGVADRVAGLDLGADDYLTKPFAYLELLARLRALGRRVPGPGSGVLEHGGIVLDTDRRIAERTGRPLALTPKELAVLEELLRAAGGYVGVDELHDAVWAGGDARSRGVVKTTVHTLRLKLGAPDPVRSGTGLGYRLAP